MRAAPPSPAVPRLSLPPPPGNRRPHTSTARAGTTPGWLSVATLRCGSRLAFGEPSPGGRFASASARSSRVDRAAASGGVPAPVTGVSVRSRRGRPDSSTTFKSFAIAADVRLQELGAMDGAASARAIGALALLDDAIATLPGRRQHDLFAAIVDVVRSCYVSPHDDREPFVAIVAKLRLERAAMEYDLAGMKRTLVEQAREIGEARARAVAMSSSLERATIDAHRESRKARMLERNAILVRDQYVACRHECDAIADLNRVLAAKVAAAAADTRRLLADADERAASFELKANALAIEVEVERQSGAERGAQVDALRLETVKLRTQLEIVESAIESMSRSASSAMDDAGDGASRAYLTEVLEEAELCKRGPIAALGTGRDVPAFLRYDGWIAVRPMSKGKIEEICKRVWALKTARSSSSGGHGQPLCEFFAAYLERKWPVEKKRFEFAYSFIASLKSYLSDPDCDMFYRVLYQEVAEDAFFDQMRMVSELKHLLSIWDTTMSGERDGRIPSTMFFSGLQMFFPAKSPERLCALIAAVEHESMTDGEVDLVKLLAESDQGDQSRFVELARSQMLAELVEFRNAIDGGLRALTANDRRVFKTLCAHEVRHVIEQVAVGYSTAEVDDLMRRGMDQDVYYLDDIVDVGQFMLNLSTKGLLAPKGNYMIDGVGRIVAAAATIKGEQDRAAVDGQHDADDGDAASAVGSNS